jgi:LAO/AO transport system kinase
MEIPDVIVVNKADHPMTDTMIREVRGVLALAHDPDGWKVPILRTEAARGEGVAELAKQIGLHRDFIEERGLLAERRARNLRSEVLGIAASRMRRRLEETIADDPGVADLLEKVVSRELDPASAASRLLEEHPSAG